MLRKDALTETANPRKKIKADVEKLLASLPLGDERLNAGIPGTASRFARSARDELVAADSCSTLWGS